jgi:hypothetical protein
MWRMKPEPDRTTRNKKAGAMPRLFFIYLID